jgi:hypothetical protein
MRVNKKVSKDKVPALHFICLIPTPLHKNLKMHRGGRALRDPSLLFARVVPQPATAVVAPEHDTLFQPLNAPEHPAKSLKVY